MWRRIQYRKNVIGINLYIYKYTHTRARANRYLVHTDVRTRLQLKRMLIPCNPPTTGYVHARTTQRSARRQVCGIAACSPARVAWSRTDSRPAGCCWRSATAWWHGLGEDEKRRWHRYCTVHNLLCCFFLVFYFLSLRVQNNHLQHNHSRKTALRGFYFVHFSVFMSFFVCCLSF